MYFCETFTQGKLRFICITLNIIITMGKLYRSSNRVIAGVCAGLADEFGLDVKVVRIVTLVAALLLCGAVAIAYLILALILPVKK